MAISVTINSGVKGKVGNLVYRKNAGNTTHPITISQYQPEVSNPRTQAQLNQRARVILAGSLSALMSKDLLKAFDMGGNRQNRGAFISDVCKKATVAGTGLGTVASIALADLPFSRGRFQNRWNVVAGGIQGGNTMSLALNAVTPDAVGTYGVRVVAITLHTDNGSAIYDGSSFMDIIPNATTVGATMDLSTIIRPETQQECHIYAVPLRYDAANSSVNIDDLVGDNHIATAGLNVALALSGVSFGATQHVGHLDLGDSVSVTMAHTVLTALGVLSDGVTLDGVAGEVDASGNLTWPNLAKTTHVLGINAPTAAKKITWTPTGGSATTIGTTVAGQNFSGSIDVDANGAIGQTNP